jgi:2-oxo-4-hydroxy-4-carboxy--5-ureidoimidazoline (OHCU) decarboxylase
LIQPSQSVLEQLFENAPRFVGKLLTEPAYSYEELINRAETIARELPEDEQIELLDGHPRIGAQPSSVSAQSFREQGYDHDGGTSALQERLHALNDAYERRFGFRFVIFVAGRPRSEIADIMESRLSASRDEELARGLSDVFAIARDRLMRHQALE